MFFSKWTSHISPFGVSRPSSLDRARAMPLDTPRSPQLRPDKDAVLLPLKHHQTKRQRRVFFRNPPSWQKACCFVQTAALEMIGDPLYWTTASGMGCRPERRRDPTHTSRPRLARRGPLRGTGMGRVHAGDDWRSISVKPIGRNSDRVAWTEKVAKLFHLPKWPC